MSVRVGFLSLADLRIFRFWGSIAVDSATSFDFDSDDSDFGGKKTASCGFLVLADRV